MAREKRKAVHYVNNAQFSQAVVDYVKEVQTAKDNNQELPIVPDYIAESFMKIAEGLSHKDNFIRYTFREEMVMDAVENCLKAIENFNIDAATRTGKPNAFAYFTQISWYAFLRRIAKEKKQSDIRLKYLSQVGIDSLAMIDLNDKMQTTVAMSYVDTLKSRIDNIKERDTEIKIYGEKERQTSRLDDDDD